MPIYLRNTAGRFISSKKAILTGIFWLAFVFASLYLFTELLVIANDWSKAHGIRKPVVLLVGFKATGIDSVPFMIVSQSIVYDREPLQILSPFVVDLIADQTIKLNELTYIEQVILNEFGADHFRVMRAVAKCESGLNPEAVNWLTRDVGLFQINLPIWQQAIKDQFGYTIADLFNPEINAIVAHWVWDRANGIEGDNIGNVTPWVATTTHCFGANL